MISKISSLALVLLFSQTLVASTELLSFKKSIVAPKAKEIPFTLEKHGDVRNDEYYWLKNREDKEVINYLKQENSYFEKVMKPTQSLKFSLFNEMKSRIKEDDTSYPLKDGPFEYFSETVKNKNYPIYKRFPTGNPKQTEILFDLNQLAKGHSFFSAFPSYSENQKIASLAVDTVGRDIYTIRFKDLSSGKFLKNEIKDVTEDVEWALDNKTLFYVKQDPKTLRRNQVFRYNLETGRSELVFEEKQETFGVSISTTLSKQSLFILSSSTLSSEINFIPLDKPYELPQLLLAREANHEIYINEDETHFYFLTNKNAKNFKIVRVEKKNPQFKNSIEVVPHREDTFIDNFYVFKDFIAVNSRTNGVTQIEIINKKDKTRKLIKFEDTAYTVSFGSNAEYNSPFLRYEYESLRNPSTIYEYSFTEDKSYKRKTKEVRGYNSELYVSERVYATSRDGTKIPISILRKKDNKLDGKSPALIYGYGSYGSSMDPWFSSSILSLVNRGFIYAIAHIRGGGEMGRAWTDNGRVLSKKNTFFDFIDCTEHLIQTKYADPNYIFAMGGSAGGLLMGAINNYRPDLYKGIVAQVPFVDVVTTMLDDSIPLTTAEYDEWGNPNEKKFYEYIKSYSPYDNVEPKKYPNMLITTGLHDPNVQYWEPAKWTARLRKNNLAQTYILLRTDMTSGHGGKSGRYDQLKERAEEFSFILGQVPNNK